MSQFEELNESPDELHESPNELPIRNCTSFNNRIINLSPESRSSEQESPTSLSSHNSYVVDSGVQDSSYIKHKCCDVVMPIGIFWDIENCQVPKTKCASLVVQRIRELFYTDFREAEFLIVCDVKKESANVIQELNDSQVNLIHISATSKNAADDKLRQQLRRFSEIHEAPSAVALITSDINFAADLYDLRYRKKIQVILIHNSNVADALMLCANVTYNFKSITEGIPFVTKNKLSREEQEADLIVFNLPVRNEMDKKHIKMKLTMLTNNCGGKVMGVNKDNGTAIIRFCTHDFALRAQKRLDGEKLHGNKISVSNPVNARESPFRNYAGRRTRNPEASFQTNVLQNASGTSTSYNANNSTSRNPWFTETDQQMYPAPNLLNSQSMFRPIRGSGYLNTSYNGSMMSNSCAGSHQFQSFNQMNGDVCDSKVHQTPSKSSSPIELIISNLDGSIDIKELRSVLLNMLKQYAMVLNMTISTQTDGSPIATVKVGSQQEAQFVISQLHHQWLGNKRVTISYSQTNSDPDQLRFMIVALLQKVPGNRMPLFKFFELVESRYHCTISLSEVNKLKDVCKITDGQGGRMITLTSEALTASPLQINNPFILYCTTHCPNGLENGGWGEAECITLPNVRISLKPFSNKIGQMLLSHMGRIPLLSFPVCYSSEFGQPLPIDDAGVPLEHLVTCIGAIELTCSTLNKNLKYLKFKGVKENGMEFEDSISKSVSPSLMTNITMLCREVVDLLKTTDRCQLLMSRFIPAYHHHFGRQCRVADYGFTRLADLFEAISHVVQILGTGTARTITLTHSAQMRRFTSDLLRVLKISKQVSLCEFPVAYKKVMHKTFNPVEYGLCVLEDLLDEIPENTIVISERNSLVTIAIPKREQTIEEMQKTQQFAAEVFQLLKHAPNCSILFNKFVPAYHHHFGRQCKVSDYGFAKLAELFESIPETVELEGTFDVDRKVKLKSPLALRVLGAQIQMLLKETRLAVLRLNALATVYKHTFGYTLNPQSYSSNNLDELITKLNEFVEIVYSGIGPLLISTKVDTAMLEIRVWSLLLFPPHSLNIATFVKEFNAKFHGTILMNQIEELKNVVQVSNEGTISLADFYIMAAHIYHILYANSGFMKFQSIGSIYLRKYGKPLCPSEFNANSLEDLFKHLNFMVILKIESGNDITVYLNNELAAYGVNLPLAVLNETVEKKKDCNGWPLPSTSYFGRNCRRSTPPKPDTPPSENCWGSNLWSTPTSHDFSLNLSIPILPVDANKVFMATEDLVSPTRSVLTSYIKPPRISAPHPTVVPLPDKLIAKDDSSDSGVNTTRVEGNLSETELNFSEFAHLTATSSKGANFNKTFSTFDM